MKIKDFFTEQFFADYEFIVKYQICNSDCETITVGELLTLAGRESSEFESLNLGYTEATGSQQIRTAISRQYQNVDPESVVFLGSPVEGIFLVANALLEKGDEVVVLNPCYDALRNTFEFVVGNGNLKTWSFTKQDGLWQLDLEELQRLISPKTKMLVVNFPHNPTGFLPTEQFQIDLCEIAKNNRITVFCDEIYFGLVHESRNEVPSIADLYPESIVLSGLSKTHGLPGLRAGWLIIKDEFSRDRIVNWKHYTSLCHAAPSEYLAEVALSIVDKLKKRNLAIIKKNFVIAAEFLQRWHQLFSWSPPKAGTTALVECKIRPVSEFAVRLAEKANILILPTVGLGMNDDHFRLGLGRMNFPEAIAELDKWLESNPQIKTVSDKSANRN